MLHAAPPRGRPRTCGQLYGGACTRCLWCWAGCLGGGQLRRAGGVPPARTRQCRHSESWPSPRRRRRLASWPRPAQGECVYGWGVWVGGPSRQSAAHWPKWCCGGRGNPSSTSNAHNASAPPPTPTHPPQHALGKTPDTTHVGVGDGAGDALGALAGGNVAGQRLGEGVGKGFAWSGWWGRWELG